jgi:hypothetical protein
MLRDSLRREKHTTPQPYRVANRLRRRKVEAMDSATKWMLILSALTIVLGFAALLCGRIYVTDGNTGQSTEVDLPLVGKMKTNYPALVFVLVGAMLAIYTLKQHYQLISQTVAWNIKGTLTQPGHNITDWRYGEIKLVDLGPNVQIKEDGEYEIDVQLPASETFESAVQQIYYTTRNNGSALLVPSDALGLYQKDRSTSPLQSMTKTTRVYGPLMVKAPDAETPE